MARGKRLSESERAAIAIYKEQRLSNRKIAIKLGRSEAVIRNFLKKGEDYGLKLKTKGNSKLTDQQKDQIVTESTVNQLTANQIKDKLELPVTKQHIALVLRGSSNYKGKTRTKKSNLTKTSRPRRATTATVAFKKSSSQPWYLGRPGRRSGKWLPL